MDNLLAGEKKTPLEEAQEIMYDAYEAGTKAKRIKLAKKALTISQDCADAYILLAEESIHRKRNMNFIGRA